MKHIIPLLLVTISLNSMSQYEGVRKITMIADVVQRDGTKTRTFLHSIVDSAVYLMDVRANIYSDIGQAQLRRVDAQSIASIKFKKKGQIGTGVAAGAVAGMVAGAVTGLAADQDSPNDFIDIAPGVSALGGAVIGLPVGGIIGAVIAIPKRFRIHGDMEKYKKMQAKFYKRIKRK